MRDRTTKGPATLRTASNGAVIALMSSQPRTVVHDHANALRRDIRARGLKPSRWLDDVAGRRRGSQFASHIARTADEMEAAGASLDEIDAHLIGMTRGVLTARTQQRDGAA